MGGAAPLDATDGNAPLEAPPFEPPGPAPLAARFHADRWQELKEANVFGLARAELAALERAAPNDDATIRFLLRAYPTVDGAAAALRLLRRRDGDAGLSASEREHLQYPLAFWSSVRHAAQATAVDPLLVESVMRQESLFDPDARSPADAYGLMQLLPATAEQVAASDGKPAPGADADLTQPDVNVQLGTRYLGTLVARFHGDVLKALAAYNGGERAVENWERRFADLDEDEFVESISYRETRDYVKKVVTNYRTYRQLYGVSTN